jgi:serine/threonine protein kinase/tetratricopeptide (TPR) repeat protein
VSEKQRHNPMVTSAATLMTSVDSARADVTLDSSLDSSLMLGSARGQPPSGQVVIKPGTDAGTHPAFSPTVVDTDLGTDHHTVSDAQGNTHALPKRIGHYNITRLIGAGGMGAVYEAQQDNPRRTVALKVMRGAIASPSASRRFEYESQLLARLRHAAIAQVYEAGTHVEPLTGAQFPYFAMEFIPGACTLTDFARERKLTLQQRLELFITICDAVHHGHQRGVIHRDLKPANILVDNSGHAKIIDFGVARASAEEQEAELGPEAHTRAGQLVGTIQYMAPEQCGGSASDAAEKGKTLADGSVSGGGLDIDTRVDVYALGVILFELLTGALPHDLEGTALFAAVMIVREDAPARPSSLVPELKGDLDTIILKALEKDRVRRYGSAADLAADIGRHLRHEPILARSIGPVGRLARWVRRNRAVATVGAISSIVLVSTSVVLVTRIVRESARANAALIDAERNLRAAKDNFSLIKTFFGSMRPNDQNQGLVDVEKLLDNAAKQLKDAPPDLPATEADFREIIAGGYQGLGRYSKSIEHQQRVVDLRLQLSEVQDLSLADSLHQFAAALWWNGQHDRAAPYYEQSLAIRRQLLPAEHADIALSLTHLAACKLKQDDLPSATRYYQQALDMRRRLQGTSSPEIAASMNNLAKCYALAGQTDRAEQAFRGALAMIQSIRGENDLTTATAQNNMGLFLIEAGKPDEAMEFITKALATRQAKLSAGHHFVALSRLGHGRARFSVSGWAPGKDYVIPQSNITEARAAFDEAREGLALLRQAIGTSHPEAVEAAGHVGLIAALVGDRAVADELLMFAASAVESNTTATKRDRLEVQLRSAIGRALTSGSSGSEEQVRARAELSSLLETISPGQVALSLYELAGKLTGQIERGAAPLAAPVPAG